MTESILGQDGGEASSHEADVNSAYGADDATDGAMTGSGDDADGDGESHAADIDAGYEDGSDSPAEGENGLDLGR